MNFLFRKIDFPAGGTQVKVSDVDFAEYDHVVCRPRWLMLLGFCMYLLLAAVFHLSAGAMGDSVEANLLGCAIAFLLGYAALVCLSGVILPRRWRFLFAVGPKGVLLRKGFFQRSHWLFPWTEVTGIDKATQYVAGTGGMDYIALTFLSGEWRYPVASFISIKKVAALVEKYRQANM